jgi:hypothetical protein
MTATPTVVSRLPLVGEAVRPADRGVLAAGQSHEPQAAPAVAPAPIVVVHGVGDFRPGDLIEEIARQPVFSRRDDFTRETVFARDQRYTLLRDARGDAASDSPRQGNARLLEVNWSDVRRAMPNVLGLLQNFVSLLMALMRIGVGGAYRSRTIATRLYTATLTLWLVEGLLVWASLVPALSALLWQLDPGERMAAGALLAAAAFYAATLLQHLSLPLAAGGVVFGFFAFGAGWFTCFTERGHLEFAALSAVVHSWALLAAAGSVLLSAVEVIVRPDLQRAPGGVRWVHRLARIGCLWLPLVLLLLLQPLTVSALLVPMDGTARTNWGEAFSRDMPFDPRDGKLAAGLIAAALGGTMVLGALQFRLVQRFGRNTNVGLGLVGGVALLAGASWLRTTGFADCALCNACLRTDWLAAAGVMLTAGAGITWFMFARSQVPRDPHGAAWYPAGIFARFWASVALAAVPLVLTVVLLWLAGKAFGHGAGPQRVDAADVFIQATKFALLLAPMATRPFAALLDALGDVFFFAVRERALSTRHDTLPRPWQALRLLCRDQPGRHVVVFAHSQGTVIAAAIFSRMARTLLRAEVRLTLVTVGSPITTLYRNFLGVEIGTAFASLCASHPQRFRWINLYRPADYVGGEIELPGVVNRDLLTPGDHVGYWRDRELLLWLQQLCASPGAARV